MILCKEKLSSTICSYHVTYAFQSESTLYICLNVKQILAQNRRNIWSLSDSNGTRSRNHLVCKRTLNHLPNRPSLQTKWFVYELSGYEFESRCYHLKISKVFFPSTNQKRLKNTFCIDVSMKKHGVAIFVGWTRKRVRYYRVLAVFESSIFLFCRQYLYKNTTKIYLSGHKSFESKVVNFSNYFMTSLKGHVNLWMGAPHGISPPWQIWWL